MQLPDYPLSSKYSGPTFLPHYVVLKYIRDLATDFDLERRIRMATEVVKVEPIKGERRGMSGHDFSRVSPKRPEAPSDYLSPGVISEICSGR